MKLFIDANVLITVLNKELISFTDCARLLSLADHRKFELFTSPMCLGISFYFAQKKSGEDLAKKKIEFLCSKLSISSHSAKDIKATLQNKQIHDFEDGLEYYSALASNCKCIITNDTQDFYFSEIEVLRPNEFLMKYAVQS